MKAMKYFTMILMSVAAVSLLACSEKAGSEGGEEGEGGEPSGPSIQKSAKIHFVSRLSDAALMSSDSDVDAVSAYIDEVMNGGTESLSILDNAGDAGYVAQVNLDTDKWCGYAVHGQKSAEDFSFSAVLFNKPASKVDSYCIMSGSYVAGVSSSIDGVLTNLDADGNVTSSSEVEVAVGLYSCHFESEEQISSFCSDVLSKMKATDNKFVLVGAVKNGLMETLQSSVSSADSAFSVTEVKAGSGYSIFVMMASRYWEYNGVSETQLDGGITSYDVDIAWK